MVIFKKKKDLSKHFNFMLTNYAFCVGKHIWMPVAKNDTKIAQQKLQSLRHGF